jgi:hypothetical protein
MTISRRSPTSASYDMFAASSHATSNAISVKHKGHHWQFINSKLYNFIFVTCRDPGVAELRSTLSCNSYSLILRRSSISHLVAPTGNMSLHPMLPISKSTLSIPQIKQTCYIPSWTSLKAASYSSVIMIGVHKNKIYLIRGCIDERPHANSSPMACP